jgi:hypothetical protein
MYWLFEWILIATATCSCTLLISLIWQVQAFAQLNDESWDRGEQERGRSNIITIIIITVITTTIQTIEIIIYQTGETHKTHQTEIT